MNLIKRFLGIEDRDYTAAAAAISEEIHAAQMEKQRNARRIEDGANQQALSIRSSDRVMNTWQGASIILRDQAK